MAANADDADIVKVRRRQGRAIITRKAILDAALSEFAAVGFEGATTRTIAERAGVPHGLVIYHFENKLGIWQSVIEAAYNELHSRFVRLSTELAGSDPEFMLKSFYRDFIMTTASRPELGWIFSHEVSGRSDRMHWLLERIRGEDLSLTLDLIKELQAKGRFIAGDAAHLHFTFIGAASRVFALAPEIEHHVGVSPFSPDFVAKHVALCHSLFFRDA